MSTNLRCAIMDVIFILSNNRPVGIYNSHTIFCRQFRNWDWPFLAKSFRKKIAQKKQLRTTKIAFHALDLRNNGCLALVKTKKNTRAQCLMVNTGFLNHSLVTGHFLLHFGNFRFLRHLRCNSLITLIIICVLMGLNISAYENVFLEHQFFCKKGSM